MAFPGLTFREQLAAIGQTLVDELDALLAQIVGYLSVEHHADGSHADVHADSVSVDDNVTVGGAVDLDGELAAGANVIAQDGVVLGGVTDAGSVEIGLLNTDADWQSNSPDAGLRVGRSTRGWLAGTLSVVTAWVWASAADASSGPVLSLERESANTYALGGPSVGGGTNVVDLGLSSPSQRRFRKLFLTDAIFERGRTTALGEWINVAYAAGNFTASTGSWTVDAGDQATYAYTLIGKTMHLAFTIDTTDVSAAAAHLRLAIPGSFTAAVVAYQPFQAINAGGAATTGLARIVTGQAYVELFSTMNAGAWTITAADNTYVRGLITIPVQ